MREADIDLVGMRSRASRRSAACCCTVASYSCRMASRAALLPAIRASHVGVAADPRQRHPGGAQLVRTFSHWTARLDVMDAGQVREVIDAAFTALGEMASS